MKSHLTPIVFLFVLALTAGTGCKKADTPGANEVFMENDSFTPSSITVMHGTAITWTNKDNVTHTVTDDKGSFDSGNVSGGGTFSHTFSTAGTFTYHCNIHSNMHGTVIVQ